jgi:hypothetical protein
VLRYAGEKLNPGEPPIPRQSNRGWDRPTGN